MRKLLFALLVMMAGVSIMLTASAETTPTIALKPVSDAAECLRTQNVGLMAQGNGFDNLYTAQLEVVYDPKRLELISQNVSSPFLSGKSNAYTRFSFDPLTGNIKAIVSLTGKVSGVNGPIDMLSMFFKSKVIGKTRVEIRNAKLVDSLGKYIKLSGMDAIDVNILPNPLNILLTGELGQNGWYISPVTASVEDIDAAKIEYLLNGLLSNYYGPVLINESGIHTLQVNTDDGFGYVKSKSIDFKIDTIKPSARIVPMPKDWHNAEIVAKLVYGDEGGSLLDKAYYRWSVTSDTPNNYDEYSGIDPVQKLEGSWYLHLKAVDGAGNASMFVLGPFGIDLTAPEIGADTQQRDWERSPIVVKPSISDAGGSDLKEAKYSWSNEQEKAGDWLSYTGGTVEQTQNGVWYLHLKAEDTAGNTTYCNFGPYKIDQKAPDVSVDLPKADWTNDDITVSPEFSDHNASGIKKLEYAWGASQGQPDIWEEYVAGSLSQDREGIWYLHIKTQDNVGNIGTYTFGPYKIDKTSPDAVVEPQNNDWSKTDITVIPTLSDLGGSEIERAMYSWSASESVPRTWNAYAQGPINLVEEGIWYLHMKVLDYAGNEVLKCFGPYKEDKSMPVITHTFAEEYTYMDSISLSYEVEDPLSGVESSKVYLNGVECIPGSAVTLNQPGNNTIEITATDRVGNSIKVTKQFNVIVQASLDVDPDVINLGGNGNGMVTAYIEFPEGVDVVDILHSSIRLNGVNIPISDLRFGYVKNPISDYDGDGKLEYMVKFRREDIEQELIQSGGSITITGQTGSYSFRTSCNVTIKQ